MFCREIEYSAIHSFLVPIFWDQIWICTNQIAFCISAFPSNMELPHLETWVPFVMSIKAFHTVAKGTAFSCIVTVYVFVFVFERARAVRYQRWPHCESIVGDVTNIFNPLCPSGRNRIVGAEHFIVHCPLWWVNAPKMLTPTTRWGNIKRCAASHTSIQNLDPLKTLKILRLSPPLKSTLGKIW